MKSYLLLLLGVFFISFSTTASADTLQVDKDNPACSDVTGMPYCTIQAAVDAAMDGDLIQIAAGTYHEKIATGTTSITLQGMGPDATILDGTGIIGSIIEIFEVADINLKDLRFENANDQDDGYGGAIEIGNTNVNLDIFNCTFSNNKADNGGAAFYSESASVTITNSHFIKSEVGADGGAIDMSDGILTIRNSEFRENKALGGDGGAIRMTGSTQLDLKDSFLIQNQASNWGGALQLQGNGTHIVQETTFEGNTAGVFGGALLNQLSGGGSAWLRNVTLSGNSADADGGAIYNAEGSLVINNATITNNTADADNGGVPGAGGGIYNLDAGPATTTLRNTIVGHNQDPSGGENDCFQTVTSDGFNLIETVSAGCSFVETTGDITGQDPLLAPLADNGGPTPTHALQTGSPALDQGSCMDSDGNDITQDQRGSERPTTGCDMGAYEASVCGDNIQGIDEECDDGNTVNGDGCDSTCLFEVVNNNPTSSSGCRLSPTNPSGSATVPLVLIGFACFSVLIGRVRKLKHPG